MNKVPGQYPLSINPGLKLCLCVLAFGFLPLLILAADDSPTPFSLKDGDTVCFYGDSITEQRYYGVDIETYVRTRFPHLHIDFVNSGVGGDKVTGGWAGPIDLRLKRDVFPFKPSVVTIMLGMNDGKYMPFDQNIFSNYTNGYEHIIQSLQEHLAGVRIVLLEPTPYDDVTEPPKFPGGYNEVLLHYAAFVRQLAAEHGFPHVDLNQPLVEVMNRAMMENTNLAHEVIPGRVHPSAAGELVMAQKILQAWNATATITAVTIDAASHQVIQSVNTAVDDVNLADGVLSWTQRDECLPFPILALHEDWPQFPPMENMGGHQSAMNFFTPAPRPRWDYTNAATEMIVRDSGFYQALDQEPLQVAGLKSGNYLLTINGQPIGKFSAGKLAAGINLAQYPTPMLGQSYRVLDLVWQQVQWRFFAWRGIQTQLSFDHNPGVQQAVVGLINAMTAEQSGFVKQQYATARPRPAHYQLIPAS